MPDNAVHVLMDGSVPRFYDQHGVEVGAVSTLYNKATFTHDQIKQLPVNPATGIAVPGVPGKLIVVHRSVWVLHISVAYTNVNGDQDAGLYYGNAGQLCTVQGVALFFEDTADRVLQLPGRIDYLEQPYTGVGGLVGQAVYAIPRNTDRSAYTGGTATNSLDVHTWYSLI